MRTRREVLSWIGAMALVGPGSAIAQSRSKNVVGSLLGGPPAAGRLRIAFFKQGMENLGYTEGKNVEYVHRWANSAFNNVPALTRELVGAHADVVVVAGVFVARQVQQVAPAMPIVLAGGFDPVAAGLADNLAKPGRSVTGIANEPYDLTEKHLRLIREALPGAVRVGVLHSMNLGNELALAHMRKVAHDLGFELVDSGAGSPKALGAAFDRLRNAKVEALVIFASPVFDSARPAVIDQATGLGVLTVYPDSGYAEAGGTLSYGPLRTEVFFSAASYVDKILKGAKAGDLPMELPTKFELVANTHTAGLLGIALPRSILDRADDVVK
jgi:ABC-type uncharacterized transport system substrate-binding protein